MSGAIRCGFAGFRAPARACSNKDASERSGTFSDCCGAVIIYRAEKKPLDIRSPMRAKVRPTKRGRHGRLGNSVLRLRIAKRRSRERKAFLRSCPPTRFGRLAGEGLFSF